MSKLILSPVGTSLLTNIARSYQKTGIINDHSNAIGKDFPQNLKLIIEDFKRVIQETFSKNDITELKKASAELNNVNNV